MITVVIVDELPPGHPANAYDITTEAISAYLSSKLNAALALLTSPQVMTHHVEYSRPRSVIRHYWTVQSS